MKTLADLILSAYGASGLFGAFIFGYLYGYKFGKKAKQEEIESLKRTLFYKDEAIQTYQKTINRIEEMTGTKYTQEEKPILN